MAKFTANPERVDPYRNFKFRVKIGNNCVIGAGAIIMPGAVLEDDVKLGAGAVVTKAQILEKGKTYGGVPAKEIKPKKVKKV